MDCPLCERIANGNGLAELSLSSAALNDVFPSSEGHMLVVPTRHVTRVEELDAEEWSDLFELVRKLTVEVSAIDGVDGVNIGVNSGSAAGQTVDHAHVHIIPRETGDVNDPRGGVRWVLPETADYWNERWSG